MMKHAEKLFYVALKEMLTMRMLLAYFLAFVVLMQSAFIGLILQLTSGSFDPQYIVKFRSEVDFILPFLVPIWVIPQFQHHVYRRQLLTGFNRFDIYAKIWLQGFLFWLVFMVLAYAELSILLMSFNKAIDQIPNALLDELQYNLPVFGFKFMLVLALTFFIRNYLAILGFLFFPLIELGISFLQQKLLKTKFLDDYLPTFMITQYSKHALIMTYPQLVVFTLTCGGLMWLTLYSFFKKEL